MAAFTVNGVSYQSRLMDGETQTLVLKRLLPTFTAMIKIAEGLAVVDEGETAETPNERMSRLAMPVAEKLAALADKDVTFILDACMEVTQRQAVNGTGWVGVRQRGIVQDQGDSKFVTRLTIAWHVLAENFGDMLGSLGLDVSKLSELRPAALG